jgi:putative DNA methylase
VGPQKRKAEIGDLYPLIPDPKFKDKKPTNQKDWLKEHDNDDALTGYLMPVAYLWSRTVTCKNPACKASVPLVRQTWLCKKKGRYVALRMVAPKGEKRVRFDVIETREASDLGFDPEQGSKGGNATCLFCGTIADDEYVRNSGMAKQTGRQLMAVACTSTLSRGKVYLSGDTIQGFVPEDGAIALRIEALCKRAGLTVPEEPINPLRPSPWTRGASGVTRHGMMTWGDLFTPRQMLCLLTFSASVRNVESETLKEGGKADFVQAIQSHLGMYVDRSADHWSSLCAWNPAGEKLQHTYGRQALPMVWDYAEANPFGGSVGDWIEIVLNAENGIEAGFTSGTRHADVRRGSSISLPWQDAEMDAVITDPPYYDNVPYADISDFFYVWLKRTISHMYPEHFASETTPKKGEATALSSRHGGDMEKARREYEETMAQSFREVYRVLRPGARSLSFTRTKPRLAGQHS